MCIINGFIKFKILNGLVYMKGKWIKVVFFGVVILFVGLRESEVL